MRERFPAPSGATENPERSARFPMCRGRTNFFRPCRDWSPHRPPRPCLPSPVMDRAMPNVLCCQQPPRGNPISDAPNPFFTNEEKPCPGSMQGWRRHSVAQKPLSLASRCAAIPADMKSRARHCRPGCRGHHGPKPLPARVFRQVLRIHPIEDGPWGYLDSGFTTDLPHKEDVAAYRPALNSPGPRAFGAPPPAGRRWKRGSGCGDGIRDRSRFSGGLAIP